MKAKTIIGSVLIALGVDILTNGHISKLIVDVLCEVAEDKEIKEDIKKLIIILGKAIEEGDKNEL